MNLDTRMFREAADAPAAVRAQLSANRDAHRATLGGVLRSYAPRAVVTCARGSSDHAATYARYLIETRTGLLASSAAPSVSSLYAAKADLEAVLFVAISQSGASPDLLAAARAAKDAGALVVALVNAEGLAAGARRQSRDPAARRRGNQRRRHEVVHRLARRDRAARRRAGRGTTSSRMRCDGVPDQLAARMAARLERGDRAASISQ